MRSELSQLLQRGFMRGLVVSSLGVCLGRAAAAIMPLVGLLALTVAMPASAAVEYDAILRDRLESVRELLSRRQAHRSMLTTKIERLSSRLDRLHADRETALNALSDQEDVARALERELDRLMPRLTPRLNLLDRVRKDGARAIAGLASMERSSELRDGKTRSRLLATRAPSIEQMRRASTALRLLRRVPREMTARHRDVDFQIPLMASAVSRLELKQSQVQRRRDAAIRDLADLTLEIDRLTAEEHRLARNMIARSLEVSDRVEPSGSKTSVLDRRTTGKSSVAGADLRGIALRQALPTPVARPRGEILAGTRHAAITGAGHDDAALSAKSRTAAVTSGWDRTREHRSTRVALRNALPSDNRIAQVERGRIDQGQALTPTIEAIGYVATNGTHTDGDLRIEIDARPLQRVAAPHEGRIAFAGDFRSYGLLLIIERGNGYHTLLWGFSSLDIGLGDHVRAGQIVGVMRDEPSPKLNVELRRNGQPVSPEVWLAASNSGVKG
jgi:murein DD-endopeptidase MepM/ murein hydrolase activator NlpD